MKKIITKEQIDSLLQAVFSTNITWVNGEAIRKFLESLPNLEDPKVDKSK